MIDHDSSSSSSSSSPPSSSSSSSTTLFDTMVQSCRHATTADSPTSMGAYLLYLRPLALPEGMPCMDNEAHHDMTLNNSRA
jgi:hypothetical protein